VTGGGVIGTVLCFLPLGCGVGRHGTPSREEDLRVGDAIIHIEFAGSLSLARPVVVGWVRRAAVAVTNYLGRYPVAELRLDVQGGGYEAVSDGVTHGNSEIEVRL